MDRLVILFALYGLIQAAYVCRTLESDNPKSLGYAVRTSAEEHGKSLKDNKRTFRKTIYGLAACVLVLIFIEIAQVV
jgi:hypothetical protein